MFWFSVIEDELLGVPRWLEYEKLNLLLALLIPIFAVIGLLHLHARLFRRDEGCVMSWLDKQALDKQAWREFAEGVDELAEIKESESKRLKIVKNIMSDRSEQVHSKECVKEQSLAKYFIDAEALQAEFVSPSDFKFEQFEYPEPVSLKIPIPKSLNKVSAENFINCSVSSGIFETNPFNDPLGSWSECIVNGWARYDAGSKRIFINIDSVVCSYFGGCAEHIENATTEQMNRMGVSQGWFFQRKVKVITKIIRDVGFEVKGKVFDLSFKEGIAVDEFGVKGISKGAAMVVEFDKVELINSEELRKVA